jgi:RNA polymerase sigma-70 factor (ECF subfamily)
MDAMQTQEDWYGDDLEISDSVLVQQALSGNQDAFEALMGRYKKSLFGLIHHYVGEYHEAEDILQQVWLQLYRSLDMLRPYVQIKPWLFTVARNRSLDFLRHKRVLSKRLLFFGELEARIEEDEVTFLDAIPDTNPTPEEQAELMDLQREIQLAIQSLPHTYRAVVWHFYSNQLNYAEIEGILGIPRTTVKTHFNRAKPLLRAALTTY